MPAAVMPAAATGMPAEDEAGEEDNGDDEHDAGNDADPGRDRSEAAMPVVRARLSRGERAFTGP
jgi:hypothetical protein